MSIEVASSISILSVCAMIYFGISNLKLNRKKDSDQEKTEERQESNAMVIITVELKNISNGIADIKAEMNSVKTDTRSNREEIIKLGESIKSAWKRIDIIESKKLDDN